MWRSPRALVWRALAVVVALATTSMVVRDLRTLHARAGPLGPLRSVVVARADLALGHRIVTTDVTIVERWSSQVPPGALSRTDEAIGRVVVLAVARDVPIVVRNVTPADVGAGGAIGPDERIVRVPDPQHLDPPPGAVVDVVAAARDGATGGLAAVVVAGAVVIADDAPVTGAGEGGALAGGDSAASDAPNSVALLIRASDLTRVASALAAGTIVLALAPAEEACCRATP